MASRSGAVLWLVALTVILTDQATEFSGGDHNFKEFSGGDHNFKEFSGGDHNFKGSALADLLIESVAAGGCRRVIREYENQIMDYSIKFIWDAFQQESAADRKNVEKVILPVESMSGVAYTSADQIHLSADYVGYYGGDVKAEIRGVLYHEMTHLWQWDGKDKAPSGLIEDVADYVRLTAGLAPSHWVKPGSRDKWDQGYEVTAYLLQYYDSVRLVFIANINAKLASGWDVGFFNELTGKSVDRLWSDYKAKYASSA